MQQSKVWYLKNIRLFHDMPDDFANALDRATTMQRYSGGQMIFTPQEAREKVYILKEGQVNIYQISFEGKKFIVDVLGPGDFFGDITAHDTETPALFAETTRESLLCIAAKSEFLTILKMWPEMALRVIEELGTRLNTAEQKIRDFVFHDVVLKLLNTLIRYARKHGKETDTHFLLVDRLTHEQIAALVGISRETVTRAIQTLKEKGFIEIDHERLLIVRDKIAEPL